MKFLTAFKMCFSMFTIFTPKTTAWDEKERKNMLLFLPFVGLYIGILWNILFVVVNLLPFNLLQLGVFVVSMFPFIASGFMHIDGFMDVADAIGSKTDRKRMIEILKDSRVGTFAIIYLIFLLVMQYIVIMHIMGLSDLNFLSMRAMTLILILCASRLMSTISLLYFKKIGISEYAKVNKLQNVIKSITSIAKKKSKRKKVDSNNSFFNKYFKAIVVIAIFLIASYTLVRSYSIAVIATLLAHLLCTLYCNKKFDGINGDVSGYAICISELVGFVVLLGVI